MRPLFKKSQAPASLSVARESHARMLDRAGSGPPAARLAEQRTGRVEIESVGAARRADIAATAARTASRVFWPRIADLVFSLAATLILAPAIALIAAAVAVSMGWPVLFVQPRVGEGGRVFNMYKFRTMRLNHEANIIATSEGDTRVTPLGRLLRRTRLDELPQLWNILAGDMTLIGPRPEQPALVARYTQFIPNYDLRHLMKPGLTGWAQVRFGYAADVAETRSKLAYDLYYIENKSLALDLQILARTAIVVFSRRNVR